MLQCPECSAFAGHVIRFRLGELTFSRLLKCCEGRKRVQTDTTGTKKNSKTSTRPVEIGLQLAQSKHSTRPVETFTADALLIFGAMIFKRKHSSPD